MRHCFLCDASIAGSGRKRMVRTGTTSRVSVGRRVSAATGERRSMRLVCQDCADAVDAGSRARPKAFAVIAVLAIAGVAIANSQSRKGSTPATVADLVAPASAAPASTASSSRTKPLFSVAVPPLSTGVAAGDAPPGPPRRVQPAPPSADVLGLAQAVPTITGPSVGTVPTWRHATAAGVRWSLRRRDALAMLLSIDLGGGQATTVVVAPEFERLDMPAMNERVDHIRDTIARDPSGQSTSYTFRRDGTLARNP